MRLKSSGGGCDPIPVQGRCTPVLPGKRFELGLDRVGMKGGAIVVHGELIVLYV